MALFCPIMEFLESATGQMQHEGQILPQ